MTDVQQSIYDLMGGADGIRRLVTSFYLKVAVDPDLSPLFPLDFAEIREKQYEFLTQFFGGPALYAQKHGAPMLRKRHLPFTISKKHADAWLKCMSDTLEEVGIQGSLREFVFERFEKTAHHMINDNQSNAPKQLV